MAVTSAYVQANGLRQHYLRAGDGTTAIVFTHGNSLCAGASAPLLDALAGEYTAIAVDLRGHGWSEKPEGGYNWTSLRDDLVALVRALDLDDVLFAGHSRGGGVALLAAAALPECTRGVVAFEPTVTVQIDAAGRPVPPPDAARGAELARRTERRRESFPSGAALADYYRGRDAFREWRQDAFDGFVRYGVETRADGTASPSMPARVAARLFEVLPDVAAWQQLGAVDLPVHVVFGERSGRLAPGRDPLATLRRFFPAASTSVMADVTHTGPMERPDLWEALLRERCALWPAPGLVRR